MKKEIPAPLMWGTIILLIAAAAAFFVFGNQGGTTSGPDQTLQQKQAEIQSKLTDQQTGRSASEPGLAPGDNTGESAARGGN